MPCHRLGEGGRPVLAVGVVLLWDEVALSVPAEILDHHRDEADRPVQAVFRVFLLRDEADRPVLTVVVLHLPCEEGRQVLLRCGEHLGGEVLVLMQDLEGEQVLQVLDQEV